MSKRLRILAGPNGSGKSSVYRSLKQNKNFHWGIFVNADEIEKQLRESRFIDLAQYGLSAFAWEDFKTNYGAFVEAKQGKCPVNNMLYVDNRIITINPELVDSYVACKIAEFIRYGLLKTKKDITFTYETVMSHESKLDFMREAREKGYRVYLYFVSTSSPEINVGRVATRVQEGGHSVAEEKIRSRYVRSLENLHKAIILSDRAYIFDNSESKYRWVAEYDGATGELTLKNDEIPNWVAQYALGQTQLTNNIY